MKVIDKMIFVFFALSLFTQSLTIDPQPVKAVAVSREAEWNISRIHAEDAYEDSKKLPRIRVALLDSGLDTDRDIPFVERKDFLGEEELHSLYQDSTGHGTSVAGIICARKSEDRICGIASNVDLYAARVLDGSNQAPIDRIVAAIDWAIQKKVNIIHMSFGTKYYSEELEDAVQRAHQNNILIIASAGNAGNAAEDESTIEYPAAFDEVLSVGATNSDNAVTEISSTGEELDVVAPGDQILSIGALGGVMVERGTSISAAHVTGVAAVLWGKHPEASSGFIRGLLSGSANSSAITGDCGSGIIDYEQTESNYKKMAENFEIFKKRGFSEEASVAKAKDALEENRNQLSKDQKVDYVNGAWAMGTHSGYAENAGNGTIETGQDAEIVKAGAMVPDSVDSMKIMTKHPCFHGGGYYFCNLSYLYDYAKTYISTGEGQQVKLPELKEYYSNEDTIKELPENECIQKELASCEKDFFKACWESLIAQNKMTKDEELTNKQKGYALLGAALHTMTDAIAHRGCRNDGSYSTGFSAIIHDRANAALTRPEDGIAGDIHYYRSELWRKYSNDAALDTTDKNYYKYLLENFAIADQAEDLPERSVLALEISKKVVASFQGQTGCKDMLNAVKDALQAPGAELTTNYRLRELNANWKTAKMGEEKFKLNIEEKDIAAGAKSPKDITVTIKDGKIRVKFPKESKCRYRVYCGNRSDTSDSSQYVYFKESNGKKYKTFSVKKGNLKGNLSYITTFYGSKRILKKYEIEKRIVYKRAVKKKVRGKVKTVLVSREQKVPYSYSKNKFKLKGSVFKLGKKYKLAGWTKKKNSKKITYKPNASVRFENDTKLVLYALVKERPKKQKKKTKKKQKKGRKK